MNDMMQSKALIFENVDQSLSYIKRGLGSYSGFKINAIQTNEKYKYYISIDGYHKLNDLWNVGSDYIVCEDGSINIRDQVRL